MEYVLILGIVLYIRQHGGPVVDVSGAGDTVISVAALLLSEDQYLMKISQKFLVFLEELFVKK